MGNSIYYNEEEAATKALRVGGFSIGTGDVDKGPTNTTSFFNSIDPPSGGYTIYLNKSGNQGPSIRVASNDANLILITNQISGNSYTTVTQCLQYFQGQTDKMVINRTIGAVVTEGLQQYYDFGNSICYGGVGGVATLESSCKNMVDGASATINNVSEGLSFNSANEGYFEWDGTTTSNIDTPNTGNMSLFSLDAWVYNVSGGNGRHSIFRNFWEIVGTSLQFWSYSFDNDYWRATGSNVVPYNTWTHVCTTWDGTYIRHYANGSLVYTQPTASGGTSENMYQIAGYSGRAFYGRIGTLAVYTKTLNAAEVLQNYNANSSRF
jgi:hypothetical protein